MKPETVLFTEFLGLQTSLGEPAPNSARALSNLVRNRHVGDLELPIPYNLKFVSDNIASLPQVLELERSNFLDPAIHKISNLEFENIHNFYVPDHGGKNITVAIGTYRKTGFFPGNPTIDRSGVFVRPFWDGAAWVDAWRQLTEEFIFELVSLGAAGTPSNTSENFGALANDASVGERSWTNPINAQNDGGPVTRCDTKYQEQSNYLLGTGIVPTVAAGKRIVGVELKIKHEPVIGTPDFQFKNLQLLKNGVPLGAVKDGAVFADAQPFHTTTFGSATDNWGIDFASGDSIGARFTYMNHFYDPTQPALFRGMHVDHFYLVVYLNDNTSYRLYLDNGPGSYDFAAADPDAAVFNNKYFEGWTIVYAAFGDDENYDRVRSCGYEGVKYFFDLHHLNTSFASRVAGTKIIAYRNFLTAEMPSVLNSFFHNTLNEMRLTTGNAASDVALMAGFRTKAENEPFPFDEIIAGHAQSEDWKYAVLLAITGSVAGAPAQDDGLVAGTYYFKYALVYDDGSRGPLRDAVTLDTGVYNAVPSIPIVADSAITIEILRSVGAFPKRGKGIAIYMSDDNQFFYKVREIVFSEGNELSAPVTLGPTGAKHHFISTPSTIFASDWNADIPEAQVDVGRSIADSGVIRYTQATVIGAHAYAVGVYANGVYQPNRVYSSSINGDGRSQYDNFPDDPIHALSVEYNDADSARAVIGLNNRIAVFKKRSIVLLRFDPSAGYIRDVVTKGWGIASPRTLAEYDGNLYWLDYAGVMKMNEGGIELINTGWLQDLLALDDATKESAIAVFDRNHKLYILRLDDRLWIYDLLSRQWTVEDYNDTPERFTIDDSRNRIDFLNGDNILTIGEGIVHAGGAYPFFYESNEHDRRDQPAAVDLNLLKVYLRYRSTVDFQLSLFKDDTNELLFGPVTLSKQYYRSVVLLPESIGMCTSFRWKIQGQAVDQFSAFRLQRIGFTYQPIDITGDILNV